MLQASIALKDSEFGSYEKVVYPPNGSSSTEQHELPETFEFKDYSGAMFAKYRHASGIHPDEYLESLAGNLPYIDFFTNSKSGQFFFFTYDRKYLIKTQPKSE